MLKWGFGRSGGVVRGGFGELKGSVKGCGAAIFGLVLSQCVS